MVKEEKKSRIIYKILRKHREQFRSLVAEFS